MPDRVWARTPGPTATARTSRAVALMAFPATFLDELRERQPLSEIAGRLVRLVKRGREHTGLCPFHTEKTPSFTINDDKGFYHCFGCQAHGSVFDFVMQTEGLSFVEAVEKLAGVTGMALPTRSAAAEARADQAAGLYDIMERAAGWFESQLAAGVGTPAREYLAGRGLSGDTIARFRLGFGPDGSGRLRDAMLARGMSRDGLVEAGLLIVPDDGREPYDRFRNRIIFPITDRRGRVIAFGGRALGTARAKYVNSPETALFKKGRVLYGAALAREAAREKDAVLVAEGYMDVIALAAAGFRHAVAPMGTALGEDQIRELWRLAPEPVLCLDGDEAGWRAAMAASERALPLLKPGHSLRFALLPPGEDPDSLLRGAGAPAMGQVIAGALPLADLLWQRAVGGRALATPEQRAALAERLGELVERIGDRTVRTYYRQYVAERLREAFPGAAPRTAGPSRRRPAPRHPARALRNPHRRRERLLVVTVLNHPELLARHAEDFAALAISDPALDALRRAILESAGAAPDLDLSALKQHLMEQGHAALLERVVGESVFELEWFAQPEAAPEDAAMGWLHALARHHRAVSLPQDVRAAERAFGENPNDETQAQLLALKAEEERGEGNEAALEQFGLASGRKTSI